MLIEFILLIFFTFFRKHDSMNASYSGITHQTRQFKVLILFWLQKKKKDSTNVTQARFTKCFD